MLSSNTAPLVVDDVPVPRVVDDIDDAHPAGPDDPDHPDLGANAHRPSNHIDYRLPNSHLTGIVTDPIINSQAGFQAARDRNPDLATLHPPVARGGSPVTRGGSLLDNPTARTPDLRRNDSVPCGGPISSPRNLDRESHARELGASRFDITTLAHADYHAGHYGSARINASFLQDCGFRNISADDVVTCFNDIITAHDTIMDLWTNVTMNTSGPQVNRILKKSLKLFPTLNSTSTEDVIYFYDRLQEVTPTYLIGVMPFDAVVIKHRFKGLCIPGLGVVRYTAMAKALMELLPHLIPGRLSSEINAALASVRYEMNNGYDYLW